MISQSVGQTQKIAKELARQLCPKQGLGQGAVIIGLIGELGSGKTNFVQGFAKALGLKQKIISPTFVLIKHYSLHITHYAHLYHIDCYRINNPKEILDLEWKKIISDPRNIILIEWAEKIKKILPQKCILINFKHRDKNKRWIKIKKF